MSYSFGGASNGYLELASALLTAVPITILCRYKPVDVTTVQRVVGLSSSVNDSAADRFGLQTDTTGHLGASAQAAGASGISTSGNVLTIGKWSNLGGLFISATSRYAFLDGVLAAQNTTSRTPATIDRFNIGCDYAGTGVRVNFVSAGTRIADVAVYNDILSINELMAFNFGMSPSEIRPASLVAYFPLFLDRLENNRRIVLADGGGVFRSNDHPQLYLPRRRRPLTRLVSFTSDGIVGLEALASLRDDDRIESEALASLRDDDRIAIEALSMFRDDDRVSLEALATSRADAAAALEALLTQRRDALARVEALAAQRADVGVQLESAASTRGDSPALAEALSTQRSDAPAAAESVASFRDDDRVTLEALTGSRVDAGAQIEANASARRDVALPIEALSTQRSDMPGQFELLMRVIAESGVPLEFVGGFLVVIDAALPLEFVARVLGDGVAPAEFTARVAHDDQVRCEFVLATVAEIAARLEALASHIELSIAWVEWSGSVVVITINPEYMVTPESAPRMIEPDYTRIVTPLSAPRMIEPDYSRIVTPLERARTYSIV